MSKRKRWIAALAAISAMAAGVHIINRMIFLKAGMKKRPDCETESFYDWRFGKIFYTKQGQGKPLLLIHRLDHRASGYEWSKVVDKLAENHTVYVLDLLGCGRSEKPAITYTNYLYVQMLGDFVKDVIKGKTDVMTSGNASNLAVMACTMEPSLYNRLVFLHPEQILATLKSPKANHKMLKYLVEMPILGTCIYNVVSSRRLLKKQCADKYFGNQALADDALLEYMSTLTHLGGASARFMYASVRSHFTEIFCGNALKQLDHSIYAVGSDEKDSQAALKELTEYNPAIETAVVHGTRLLMQMEKPGETLELCRLFLD